MRETVVAVFENWAAARAAIERIRQSGFTPDEIRLLDREDADSDPLAEAHRQGKTVVGVDAGGREPEVERILNASGAEHVYRREIGEPAPAAAPSIVTTGAITGVPPAHGSAVTPNIPTGDLERQLIIQDFGEIHTDVPIPVVDEDATAAQAARAARAEHAEEERRERERSEREGEPEGSPPPPRTLPTISPYTSGTSGETATPGAGEGYGVPGASYPAAEEADDEQTARTGQERPE